MARSRDTADINPITLTNKTFLRGSGISKVVAVPESEPLRHNSSFSVGGQSGGGGQVSLRLTDLLRTRSGSEISSGPISNRMYNQSSSNQLSRSRQDRSRSASRDRAGAAEGLSVTALAVSGIEKMRSASVTREREKHELTNKRNYIRPDTTVT